MNDCVCTIKGDAGYTELAPCERTVFNLYGEIGGFSHNVVHIKDCTLNAKKQEVYDWLKTMFEDICEVNRL